MSTRILVEDTTVIGPDTAWGYPRQWRVEPERGSVGPDPVSGPGPVWKVLDLCEDANDDTPILSAALSCVVGPDGLVFAVADDIHLVEWHLVGFVEVALHCFGALFTDPLVHDLVALLSVWPSISTKLPRGSALSCVTSSSMRALTPSGRSADPNLKLPWSSLMTTS